MNHAMTVTIHVLIARHLIVQLQLRDQDQTDLIAFQIITILAHAIIHVLHKTDLLTTDQELSVLHVRHTTELNAHLALRMTDLLTIVRHVRHTTDRHAIQVAAAEDVVNF